ncbi:microcystin-dependent protein [Alteromonadaceae bacterium 2753L.S.0a.02]|nr:microcystin-dependent protein [Alteromonadaceae bacterium 2753L.S.0a.02]
MDTFIGDVHIFGFNFAPRNWAFCAGQLLPISTNQALFSLLGTAYGGDGRTTFALPNLNGRTAVGKGQAPGTAINWQIGLTFGNDSHVMSLSELPAHSHSATWMPDGGTALMATTDDGTSETPESGAVLAKTVPGASPADQPEKIYANTTENLVPLGGLNVTGAVDVGTTGAGNAFNIVQPSLGVNYSIAMEGIYPSRS